MPSSNTVLTLDGSHLRCAYSVYVIELSHSGNQYYYIGQTGDSHFIAARSPIGRLGGHLQARNRSKQNQVYRYVAETSLGFRPRIKTEDYSIAEKRDIDYFFSRSQLKMYSFPAIEFDFVATGPEHQERRRKILTLEKEVIQLFKAAGKTIINRSQPKIATDTISPFPAVLQNIKEEFRL